MILLFTSSRSSKHFRSCYAAPLQPTGADARETAGGKTQGSSSRKRRRRFGPSAYALTSHATLLSVGHSIQIRECVNARSLPLTAHPLTLEHLPIAPLSKGAKFIKYGFTPNHEKYKGVRPINIRPAIALFPDVRWRGCTDVGNDHPPPGSPGPHQDHGLLRLGGVAGRQTRRPVDIKPSPRLLLFYRSTVAFKM